MATENPRVWFKSISLENVRSFGTKQTINFTDKDSNAARWNVILGDNGTGKTTVLRSIIGLFHNFGIINTTPPIIANDYFLRDQISIPKIQLLLFFLNSLFEEKLEAEYITSSSHFGVQQVEQHRYYNLSYFETIPLFGYGAGRKIGVSSFINEINDGVGTLIFDNYDLINVEEWLVQADYLAFKDETLRSRYEFIGQIILKLMRGEISDIYIDTKSGSPKVFFKTHYGDVRLHELSLGYKTLIAWMVDFAKGLLDRYPDSPDPLAEPAVCLVDEIDLHLHPKFQRNIIKFLTETFPNTQFIVTAHSPLIVVAAEEQPQDTNIILLKREGNQTVVVNDPVDVSKWSVDQILNSDLFGHTPSQSEPLTELRSERDELLSKQKLTAKQKSRLDELDEKIGFIPFGRDQTEIQAETIIQQLADVLRNKQQAQ